MKIYVLVRSQDNQPIAITEEKDDMLEYSLTKNFVEPNFFITKIKDGNICKDLLFEFEDLYLENDDFLKMVLTRVESKMIYDVLDEELERIKTTLSDLEHYLVNYKLSKKEKSILFKAYNILESGTKRKKLKKMLELTKFMGFMEKSKNIMEVFRNKLHTTVESLYIFINRND